jgi:hypothetical protein
MLHQLGVTQKDLEDSDGVRLPIQTGAAGERLVAAALSRYSGSSEVRRMLDLRHSPHMWIIDEALAKMKAELSVDLPKLHARGRAA